VREETASRTIPGGLLVAIGVSPSEIGGSTERNRWIARAKSADRASEIWGSRRIARGVFDDRPLLSGPLLSTTLPRLQDERQLYQLSSKLPRYRLQRVNGNSASCPRNYQLLSEGGTDRYRLQRTKCNSATCPRNYQFSSEGGTGCYGLKRTKGNSATCPRNGQLSSERLEDIWQCRILSSV